jgi:hypothetical protein
MHKIFVKINFSIARFLFLNVLFFYFQSSFMNKIEVKNLTKNNIDNNKSGLLLNGDFSKDDFYNIYKTLNSDFSLFMKLSIREAVNEVLKKYKYNDTKADLFVGYMSNVLKLLLKYFRNMSMNDEFCFFDSQKSRIDNKINKYIEIIDIISKDKNCKFSFDLKDFKYEIKKTLLSVCSGFNIDSDLNSADYKIKAFLWALYAAPYWKNKLKNHEDEFIFILTFPVYQNSVISTFKNIGILNSLKATLFRELKTSYGVSAVISKEIFPTFVNSKMATDIIGRRTELIKMLLNEEKNKEEIKKIKLIMEKIESIFEEMNKINVNGIKAYLSKFIPKEIPFLGIGGVNSNSLSYLFHNFREQWGSTIVYLSMGFYRAWDSYNENKNGDTSRDIVENNPFIKTIFPFIGQMSLRTTVNNEFKKQLLYSKEALKTKNNQLSKELVFFDSGKIRDSAVAMAAGNLARLHNIKISIADEAFYAQHSDSLHHRIIRGIFGDKVGPWSWAVTCNSIMSLASLYSLYEMGTGFISQFKYMSDLNKYFSLIKDIILNTKELCRAVNELYIKNNISNDEYLPELIECNESLLNKKTSKAMLNTLSLWGNGFFGKTKSIVKNIVLPGFVSRFFFQKFLRDKSLESVYSFIGAIDLALSKVSLLKSSDKRSLKFCIPKILTDNKSVKIDIKNMWYPNLYGSKPVLNTIYFGEDKKNGIIVSPTAGGKTVTLSTIITNLYMANMGIAPAESMEYTFFIKVMDNLIPTYNIGSGESNNIAERKAMKKIKTMSNKYKAIGENIIIFVDEMYKGTTPQLAVTSAFNDIKEIAPNSNLIFIMTTHFPELAKISENKDLMMKLYYLLVYEADGVFENTYLLKEDYTNDQENWWMKDFEKAKRYQEYQDKKYFLQEDSL